MNVHIEPQIISYNGKPAFAVIPWEEYQMLISNRQEPDVWFPNDVVKANSRGASLITCTYAWKTGFRGKKGDAPGTLHHVMIRGIERRNTFRNKPDRLDFLERLENLIPEAGIVCHGWAFRVPSL